MGHQARFGPPPPVSAQNPIWSPGARWPKATRCSPHPLLGTGRAGGIDPPGQATENRLDDHPGPAGSSTTPTTSWPGTKGKLTMSSK